MKVLLDESVDVHLRRELVGHDVFSVTYMGWNGLKNGALLRRAADDDFEVLVTTDQNIAYQQNVQTLPCAVIVMHAASNSFRHLKPLVPNLLRALAVLQPCSLVHVRL